MTKKELEEIIIKMAIRHPDVLQYTKKFINTGFMEDINETINEHLLKTCGLNFSYTDYVDKNGEEVEITRYVDSFEKQEYISISKIPQFVNFAGTKIEILVEENELKTLPTKLLIKGQNKGGIMLSSINDELFRWYDAIHKISSKKPYQIDPSNNETKDAKRKVKVLHSNIINKQWQELI